MCVEVKLHSRLICDDFYANLLKWVLHEEYLKFDLCVYRNIWKYNIWIFTRKLQKLYNEPTRGKFRFLWMMAIFFFSLIQNRLRLAIFVFCLRAKENSYSYNLMITKRRRREFISAHVYRLLNMNCLKRLLELSECRVRLYFSERDVCKSSSHLRCR